MRIILYYIYKFLIELFIIISLFKNLGGVDPNIRLICTMESIFIFSLTYGVAIHLRNEKTFQY